MPGRVQSVIRRLASDARRLAGAVADFRRAHAAPRLDLGLGFLRAGEATVVPGRPAVYTLAVTDLGAVPRSVTLALELRRPDVRGNGRALLSRLALCLQTTPGRRQQIRIETDHRSTAQAAVDGNAVDVIVEGALARAPSRVAVVADLVMDGITVDRIVAHQEWGEP